MNGETPVSQLRAQYGSNADRAISTISRTVQFRHPSRLDQEKRDPCDTNVYYAVSQGRQSTLPHQARSCITRCRLYPYPFKWPFVTQPRVHHAVECNSPCQAQVICARSLLEPGGDLQYSLLEYNLQR